MTTPRRVTPGRTYLITRRTEERRFLFRPDSVMNQIFLYLLALFATRFGLLIHAAILMSTHVHIVLTDPDARLPEFLMHFNRMLVLATSTHRATTKTILDKRRPSVVELLTPDAILQKMAYTIANPVASNLVRTPNEWPGTILRPDHHADQVLTITRPKVFFNKLWPPAVELRTTWPPDLLASTPTHDLARTLRTELQLIETQASHSRTLKSFMGAKRILACSPFRRSATPEHRGQLSPTFAVGRNRPTDLRTAIASLRAFRAAYRQARTHWRTGDRSRAFPFGTWWMVHFHAAKLDPPAASLAA